MTKLGIRAEESQDALVLALAGELTSDTATRFLRELESALRTRPARIVLDAQGIEEMDSAGAAALVEAYARAKRQGVPLRIERLSDAARTRLAIVGVLDHLAA